MNPEDRHKLALQIADQLNNDPQLAQDLEPWLSGETQELLQVGNLKGLETKLEECRETIEILETFVREKDAEIEKLEAEIEDLKNELYTEC